jgi:sigma-54 dependent transcriptional regulator, acetoin dehydrogenase operon transcriptional activator AcoR
VHVRARFNWPTWHALGSSGSSDEAEDVPVVTSVEAPRAPAAPAPVIGQAAAPATGLRYLHTGDAQMDALTAKVRRVLDRDIPILLLGETGTGKELLARAIHQDSARARQPFVAVNCASIPETLIESELFGYEEGAFTGARRKGAVGKIVQAHGGTLFLDEIGDMPLSLQARLLRVLQERQVTPLGGGKPVPVDLMLVAATHRPLREMIAAQTFREDLYYRINGLVVKLPPLRERTDLDAIVQKLLRAECGGRLPALSDDVLALLRGYHWPGNIRQLANVLRTAAVMAGPDAVITRAHLSDDFIEDATQASAGAASVAPVAAAASPGTAVPVAAAAPEALPPDGASTLEALELQTIRRILDECGGNISVASKRLGISRNTIYRKLRWRNEG